MGLLSLIKHGDDFIFIDAVMSMSHSVVIVPAKNVGYALLKKGYDVDDDRVIEKKRMSNGLLWVKFRLSL